MSKILNSLKNFWDVGVQPLKSEIEQIERKNFLYNWDFRGKKVNQRGANTYYATDSVLYTIDRWGMGGCGRLYVHDSDGYFTAKNTGTYLNIWQDVYNSQLLAGKTVTFSVCGQEPFSLVLQVNNEYVERTNYTERSKALVSLTYTMPNQVTQMRVFIQISDTDERLRYFYYAKLEVGTRSTAANDFPMDYAEELERCRKFYNVVIENSSGSSLQALPFSKSRQSETSTAYYGYIFLNLKTSMRVNPTVSVTGQFGFTGNLDGTTITSFAIKRIDPISRKFVLIFSLGDGSQTSSALFSQNGAKLILDAEYPL